MLPNTSHFNKRLWVYEGFFFLDIMKSEPLYVLVWAPSWIFNEWRHSRKDHTRGQKMKALLTLILQCVHIKTNVFTLYQEEYFLYRMSVWVCYRNFKAFVQRYSWIDDIEGNWRADLNATKKCELNFCYVIRQKLNFFSGNLFSNGFDTFSF